MCPPAKLCSILIAANCVPELLAPCDVTGQNCKDLGVNSRFISVYPLFTRIPCPELQHCVAVAHFQGGSRCCSMNLVEVHY